MTIPGGGRADCGRDVCRRDADAPPPGQCSRELMRHQLDDLRAARRAARAPLGLGARHLRPLRLRDRRAAALMDAEKARLRVPRRPGADRHGPARSRRRRRGELFPPIFERARLQRHGMLSRSEARWDARVKDPEHWRDGASPKYFVARRARRAGEAFAMYRVKEKWERGMPLRRARARRRDRDVDGGDAGALALPLRRRPRRARHPVELRPGLAALPDGQGRAPASAQLSATGSGCGSSTSAKR